MSLYAPPLPFNPRPIQKRHKQFCGKLDDPAARDLSARLVAEAEAEAKADPDVNAGGGATYGVPGGLGGDFFLTPSDQSVTSAVQRYAQESGKYSLDESNLAKLTFVYARQLCDTAAEEMRGDSKRVPGGPTKVLMTGHDGMQREQEIALIGGGLRNALDRYEKCRPHPTALFQLGFAYHKGAILRGKPRLRVNKPRAFELYTEACEGVSSFTSKELAEGPGAGMVHNTTFQGELRAALARSDLGTQTLAPTLTRTRARALLTKTFTTPAFIRGRILLSF